MRLVLTPHSDTRGWGSGVRGAYPRRGYLQQRSLLRGILVEDGGQPLVVLYQLRKRCRVGVRGSPAGGARGGSSKGGAEAGSARPLRARLARPFGECACKGVTEQAAISRGQRSRGLHLDPLPLHLGILPPKHVRVRLHLHARVHASPCQSMTHRWAHKRSARAAGARHRIITAPNSSRRADLGEVAFAVPQPASACQVLSAPSMQQNRLQTPRRHASSRLPRVRQRV